MALLIMMDLAISKLLLQIQKIKVRKCLIEALPFIRETQALMKEKWDQNVVIVTQKEIPKWKKSGLWIGL